MKAAIGALGLSQVPVRPEVAAHTMTAPRYPKNVNGPDFQAYVSASGVILAGGLLPAIRTEYFRIGHMGAANLGDILATAGAIETALEKCGFTFTPGVGVAAARRVVSAQTT